MAGFVSGAAVCLAAVRSRTQTLSVWVWAGDCLDGPGRLLCCVVWYAQARPDAIHSLTACSSGCLGLIQYDTMAALAEQTVAVERM